MSHCAPPRLFKSILLKQRGNADFLIDARDGLGKDRRDGEILDFAGLGLILGIRDRVEEQQLVDLAALEALDRGLGEDAVRSTGEDLLCAAELDRVAEFEARDEVDALLNGQTVKPSNRQTE